MKNKGKYLSWIQRFGFAVASIIVVYLVFLFVISGKFKRKVEYDEALAQKRQVEFSKDIENLLKNEQQIFRYKSYQVFYRYSYGSHYKEEVEINLNEPLSEIELIELGNKVRDLVDAIAFYSSDILRDPPIIFVNIDENEDGVAEYYYCRVRSQEPKIVKEDEFLK